ncbi:histidine phosphatase family protein [Novosphingobium sp. Leaf2]|uniref:histidine phosphatase family protein n=1 Tax=Novosphingobium sp. Leaf2 TaxID=1735670 RepID=UPI0006FB0273|nr:histidine phosphatase family protein [Novosphingobium sp. Leaf2]KQM21766.1 phosphoglycerate mutase [Novosphingobium sp. Leaf2]
MSGFCVHLMRHGAPVTPQLLLGHADAPPLPAGTQLCLARAAPLAFARVISSDLSRASVPARQIADLRTIPHAIDTRWRELDFGNWTGLAASEVDPAAYARFWDDPDAAAPPGGERWSDLKKRVAAALRELDQPTLIITHGGAMRAAMAVLFHMENRQVWAFDLPYSCVLTLRLWPDSGLPTAQIVNLTGDPCAA